jgi:hypothetical protein
MKTNSQTIGAVYEMEEQIGSRGAVMLGPPFAQVQRCPIPVEPEPQPGATSRNQTSSTAATASAGLTHLRP